MSEQPTSLIGHGRSCLAFAKRRVLGLFRSFASDVHEFRRVIWGSGPGGMGGPRIA